MKSYFSIEFFFYFLSNVFFYFPVLFFLLFFSSRSFMVQSFIPEPQRYCTKQRIDSTIVLANTHHAVYQVAKTQKVVRDSGHLTTLLDNKLLQNGYTEFSFSSIVHLSYVRLTLTLGQAPLRLFIICNCKLRPVIFVNKTYLYFPDTTSRSCAAHQPRALVC